MESGQQQPYPQSLSTSLHYPWRAVWLLPFIFFTILLGSCGSSKRSFSITKKYSPEQLQKDYAVYRGVLEEAHPGLYWYTGKDSMDRYFEWGRQQLNDSLNEIDFRRVLLYVTAKIDCGHTSIRSSKGYLNYLDTVRLVRLFPLSLKLWKDTVVITGNLQRRDSILKRGTVVTAIDGRPVQELVDTMFQYIGSDGYNTTHKYQALSSRGYFGSLYSALFGYPSTYTIDYIDSVGQPKRAYIKPFFPEIDTFRRAATAPLTRIPQPTRRERRHIQRDAVRLLKIDSATHVAMMDLNSFGRGYGLKKFFRRSFRALRKNHIQHLIIDVRNNTGGSPTNSTMITRYLTDHRFKIGDSLYAIARKKEYGKYIQGDFFNRLFMTFFTKKRADGYYHLGYFERHYFSAKEKNHFDGKTYILIGGNSFSATTLFADALIKQDNVTVIGEETGGGAYGNSAWQIPTVTLPKTKIRFNLPLYRLVIDKDYPRTGHGVQPEIEAGPTLDAIRSRTDLPLQKALSLIEEDKKPR